MRAARQLTALPILACNKIWFPNSPIYITPSIRAAVALLRAGADLVALDCTRRPRVRQSPPTSSPPSTPRAGWPWPTCRASRRPPRPCGRRRLPGHDPGARDFDAEFVARLAGFGLPVLAEGHINTPDAARRALDAGAWAVCVGTRHHPPPSAHRTIQERPGSMTMEPQHTFIIAEIGINHQGSIELFKKMIVEAKRVGADAVKGQKREPKECLTQEQYDRPYDSPHAFGRTYGEHKEALEISRDGWAELLEFADELGITLFASVFDITSARTMRDLGVDMIKIGSAEVTRLDLLEEVASYGLPTFLSTGMSTLEEIDRAVEILRKTNLTIMHATSSYPLPLEDLHLRVIRTLAERYRLPVGFSCHYRRRGRHRLGRGGAGRRGAGAALHHRPHHEGDRPGQFPGAPRLGNPGPPRPLDGEGPGQRREAGAALRRGGPRKDTGTMK